MTAKVDQASSVESRRTQMIGTSTSPGATTGSSRISMFGAKSGFVIPKNKLSGSMVPIVRVGKKFGGNDEANEEITKLVQRKTKWGPDLTQDAAVKRGMALAYQTRVDQITLQLKSGVLEIGDNQDSSLAAQVSDQEFSGHQNNSEKSKQLELERREAIGEILKLNPSYKAPPDYKPLLKEARVPIPVKEYPGYNFIGLIFRPGSDTLKRLEKETGAKVQVYGTKADTGQKVEITPSDGNEVQIAYEELNLHISAETFEKVDAAVALIELLVTPVSGNPAAASTTPTSASRDDASVPDQSQEVVPVTVVNPGVVQPVSGPLQTPPRGQFQYPGPWFPVGPPIAMQPPSGFIPTSNPSAPILNNPPHLPSPSFSNSTVPSLFGPRPSPTVGFGSVLQSTSPVPLRPQSTQPYFPQANPTTFAQQPLMTQPNVLAPPFPNNQAPPLGPLIGRPSMPSLPQPIPNLPSGPLPDRTMAPAGSSSGWPRAPLGPPASLGPNQMGQMTPPMGPFQGHNPVATRPVVASVAPQSNISVANMVSCGNFQSHSAAPQLPSVPQNRPITAPTYASVPPPRMGPSPTTQVSLPAAPAPAPMPNPSPRPVLGPTPVPASISSSTSTPVPYGTPNSVSGGIPGFTSIRHPVATPMPQRPSSGDFTFRPHQPPNTVSQSVPLPSSQPASQNPIMQPPMAPQPPSFRVAMHNSTPPPSMPPFSRPQVNNQMGLPRSQMSAVSFPGAPSPLSAMSAPLRPPAFQSPSPSPSPAAASLPVSQRGPGSFNPVPQFSNMPGPFPPRAGNAVQLQQNFPARPGNPSVPNQQIGSIPFAPPKPGSGGPHGVAQIYDPFSPTSVPRPPQQQQQGGSNMPTVGKQENDPEYEDLMASVGVK